MEVSDGDQAQIGRDFVAGLEKHEVAGDEFLGGKTEFFAAANDGRLSHHGAGEGGDGVEGFAFLQVPDDRVDQDDAENDGGISPLSERAGNGRSGEEDVDERLMELLEEADKGGGAADGGKAVGAVVTEAGGGLFCRKPVLGVRAEFGKNGLRSDGVPSHSPNLILPHPASGGNANRLCAYRAAGTLRLPESGGAVCSLRGALGG